ncbi:CPBP family intramembrane glutamic endopeptidase [Nocardia sp. NPDC057668]|uniref:CPBP family intramembrane glutamic endopeptidase n=1 Tax=Nocardia sp. NPDC057668 TaxID=3346202 RepID=UPI003673527D
MGSLSEVNSGSRIGTALLAAGVAIYLGALVMLLVTGNTEVRFSADDAKTQSIWLLGLPAVAGLALAWLVPPREPAPDPFAAVDTRIRVRQSWTLAALAVAFATGLHLAGGDNLWFLGLKAVLLLLLPVALRVVTWREWARADLSGRWIRPLPAVAAFVLITYALDPAAPDPIPDPVTIAAVFVLNAVLEEVFYRFWLQTRLESLYGRWAAILVTSVVFAAWHAAIQGGNGPVVDLAAAVAVIGVKSLFLGYLWSRHRNPWLVIAVHGFINAPLAMWLAMF